MFALLRRLIAAGTIAMASVIFWETELAPTLPVATVAVDEATVKSTVGQRLLIWTLFAVLAPILTAPLAVRVLGENSNIANVLLLCGYTSLDVLAAYCLNGIHLGGFVSGVAYLAALLGVLAYNVWVLAFLARLN